MCWPKLSRLAPEEKGRVNRRERSDSTRSSGGRVPTAPQPSIRIPVRDLGVRHPSVPGFELGQRHAVHLPVEQVQASIDPDTRSVTATVLGVVRREAVYREGLGCALALDGLTPPRSPGNGAAVQPDGAEHAQRFATLPNAATPIELESLLDRVFTEPNRYDLGARVPW